MALSHHAVVHLAAARINTTAKGKYVLLGDDIVIADTDLARSYLEVMTILDVPLSELKTHISEDTCEFAKR